MWTFYFGQHLVSSWINMLFIWMKFLTITWQLICVNKSDAHLFWNVFIILNFKAKHLHGDELFFLPFIQSSAAPEASPERAEESFCYTYSIARQEVCRKFVRVYDFNIDSDSMKFLHWWHGIMNTLGSLLKYMPYCASYLGQMLWQLSFQGWLSLPFPPWLWSLRCYQERPFPYNRTSTVIHCNKSECPTY